VAKATAAEAKAIEAYNAINAGTIASEGVSELAVSFDAVVSHLACSLKPNVPITKIAKFADGSLEVVEPDEKSPVRAKKGVAAARPTAGCPLPDFDERHVRATRVLKEFLTPAQISDFEEHQAFKVTGAFSGHRYHLVSRHAPKQYRSDYRYRTVYDLDEQRTLCIHDWTVPPAEELLSLALHLQLPEHEKLLREIAGRGEHEA
jgi:hypothetical protein